MVQDGEGFLWTGTTDGLQRYDGTRYKNFRNQHNDPYSLPSNPVQELMLDKKKNLWVLMSDGKVGIFNRKKFTFREVPVKAGTEALASAHRHLVTDEEGNVFLLLRGFEVVTWKEETNEFAARNNFFKTLPGWKIGDFVHRPGTQQYWMVITGGSLAIYNKTTGKLSYPGNNIEKYPVIERFQKINPYHIFFDKQGRCWFITWGSQGFPYVSCYHPASNQYIIDKADFTYLKTYYELQGFFQQQDGTVWVRGLGILAKYNEAEKKFGMVANGYRNERSIVYESVTSLMEDREKNIWVGTDNNGLYRFNPAGEYFINLKHTSRQSGRDGAGSVMSVMPTKWGTVLMGTWGDGIYHLDKNLQYIPTGIQGIDNAGGPSAWCMYASGDSNTIWIAAQPGIYKVDQSTRSAKFYNPPILQNKTVRQVVEDKKGNLWLGMQSVGVFRWSATKGRNNFDDGMERFEGVPLVQINKLLVDSKGYVWIATANEGVYVIDANTDQLVWHFGDKETGDKKLPDRGASSLLEYSDSLMIITTGTRIIKFNRVTNRSTFVGRPEFISGYVAAMEKDDNGYLWLSTTNGLYRINLQKNIFVSFNRTDGIHNDHFILAASRKLPDGRLMFGSTNELLVFNPRDINLSAPFPDVKITGFKLMNESLEVDSLLQLEEIELGYKQNSLVIEFSSLNFNSASLIKYRLEPLDKEWKTADKNNEAVYSYLPPGSYTFSMVSFDEEGNESSHSAGLKIEVKPPFWKTGWFVGLIALLAGTVLFWLDKERMQRKEAIQKMRVDIAGNLHDEINTALSNINILSEMAKLKADHEPEKSKEFIEQIHNKSHNMMIAMDDMLWSIDPDNDSMKKTVARMQEYIDALNNRHSTNIEMMVEEKVNALKLDMQFRHEAFILFKESISVLVRACATNCRIHVGLDKGFLLYTLQFNNETCEMQELNNLLQSRELGKRMNTIKATLTVNVHKSNSVLILKVPVG
jgi:ligand-binding sensor domain-containing protein/signal transduction histidine kinase